ncbi:polyprotein [Aphelenchoides avenae]|nr:polyprotein [Aphelenchus avenae]
MEVKLNLDGMEMRALWDTGCGITYFDVALVPEDKYHLVDKPRIAQAKAANGTIVAFHGSIKLPVVLKHSKVYHVFHLTDAQNCPSPCVIGTDLMLKLTDSDYIGWNIKENRMELGKDESLQLVNAITFANRLIDETEQKRKQQPLVAHVMEDTIIPPRTDMVFTAELTGNTNPETDYIIEEKPHAFTMNVGRILVTPKGKKIPMRVLNMANCPAQPDNDDNYDPTDRLLTEIIEAPADDWETQIRTDDMSRSVFNHRQKRRMIHISFTLRQHVRAFVQANGRLGRYRGSVKHRIRLIPGTKPVARQRNEEATGKTAQGELIRPSTSPFAAQIQHVPKKDGSFRMVCDYRGLNQQMEPQTYSTPDIQSILDQCAGKKIFSSVDFSQAYHQTEIFEPDIHKSAFITAFGLYEWLVTPYGMTNSGDTFAQMMQELAAQMSFRLM